MTCAFWSPAARAWHPATARRRSLGNVTCCSQSPESIRLGGESLDPVPQGRAVLGTSPCSTHPRINALTGTPTRSALSSIAANSSAGRRTDCTTERPGRSPLAARAAAGPGWPRTQPGPARLPALRPSLPLSVPPLVRWIGLPPGAPDGPAAGPVSAERHLHKEVHLRSAGCAHVRG